ncbi:MAG TPA: hypothetical protein VM370_09745 [Candidatus Thermoplasmatota archaeon]|nr:hypothetical protein [Candidatus Thermoplasmatota archaeon]
MRAILLALVFAGCLTPSLVTIPAGGATGDPPALALSGCQNLSGSFPVLASEARELLPAGFQPRSAETSLTSVFWIVSVHCAGSQVDGVETGEAWFSYGELDVLAPPAWRQPGIADYTIPLFALAQPRTIVDALTGLGLPRVALSDTTAETLPTGGEHIVIGAAGGGFEMVGQPTTGTSTLGDGQWGMFGVSSDRHVVSSIRGSAMGGTAASSVLAQTSDGALPLMAHARPVARGGAVSGFDLSFARVG